MIVDTRQESDLQAQELRTFVSDCRMHAGHLQADIATAAELLAAVQARSQTLRQKGDARLQALQQAIAALRSELQQQANAIDGECEAAAQKTQEAVQSIATRIESTLSACGALRDRLQGGAGAIERGGRELEERAATLHDALLALGDQLRQQKESADETVDQRLQADVPQHADTLTEEAARFAEGFEAALRRLVDDRLQAHAQSSQQAVAELGRQLDELSGRLEGAIAQTLDAFEQMQSQRLDELRRSSEHTDQAVREAAGLFDEHAGQMSTVTTEVTGAMDSAQLGLKVTLGSLEKVKNILEEIKL